MLEDFERVTTAAVVIPALHTHDVADSDQLTAREEEAVEIALLDVGGALEQAARELGRTVRYALGSNDRTARLAGLMIIVIIALLLLF